MDLPQKTLDNCGQLHWELVQVGDVKEGITIDALNVGLVLTDCGGNEQNALARVFLLDTTQIFLGRSTAVAAGCGLSIRQQHEYPNFLWTL